MQVERLTCSIGAEVSGVNLGDAARDATLFAEIKALLLAHKVLFLRDQDITRADRVLRHGGRDPAGQRLRA